ncbi:hypothetical protein [uncultured Campylobacter sp.]|uniref:hypothetical protein n=1 Tax=uncultured Campylobacter sp. TaxID=218934 RepID=UPI00262BF0D2|nr:hypothetical protein [uncultured Campylobacter sp.]
MEFLRSNLKPNLLNLTSKALFKNKISPLLTRSDLGGVWAADLLAVASRSKVKGRFASITPSAPPLPSKNLSLIGSDK